RSRSGAHARRWLHPVGSSVKRARRHCDDTVGPGESVGTRITRRSGAMSGIGCEFYTFDKGVVEKAYAGWAPIYDVVFGAVFAPGRTAAVRAAERVGGRILDVGVGTGISLTQYSSRNRIVGVDLSEPMLRRAKARMHRHRLGHVETLA